MTLALMAPSLDNPSCSLSQINLSLAKSRLGIVLGEHSLSTGSLSVPVNKLSPSSGSSSSFCIKCYLSLTTQLYCTTQQELENIGKVNSVKIFEKILSWIATSKKW